MGLLRCGALLFLGGGQIARNCILELPELVPFWGSLAYADRPGLDPKRRQNTGEAVGGDRSSCFPLRPRAPFDRDERVDQLGRPQSIDISLREDGAYII